MRRDLGSVAQYNGLIAVLRWGGPCMQAYLNEVSEGAYRYRL